MIKINHLETHLSYFIELSLKLKNEIKGKSELLE
jgi:hypothetical protein